MCRFYQFCIACSCLRIACCKLQISTDCVPRYGLLILSPSVYSCGKVTVPSLIFFFLLSSSSLSSCQHFLPLSYVILPLPFQSCIFLATFSQLFVSISSFYYLYLIYCQTLSFIFDSYLAISLFICPSFWDSLRFLVLLQPNTFIFHHISSFPSSVLSYT